MTEREHLADEISESEALREDDVREKPAWEKVLDEPELTVDQHLAIWRRLEQARLWGLRAHCRRQAKLALARRPR